MECPLCHVEMVSTGNKMLVEGDNSPNTATKLYIEHELSCRNEKCSNFGKIVQTIRNEVKLG